MIEKKHGKMKKNKKKASNFLVIQKEVVTLHPQTGIKPMGTAQGQMFAIEN